MKKLFGNTLLLLTILIIGCGKEEDPKEEDSFDFLSCRLISMVGTGSDTFTDTYVYDSDGRKIGVIRSPTGEVELYEYVGEKIVETQGNFYHEYDLLLPCIKEITYDSDKVFKVTVKDTNDGSIAYVDNYEWSPGTLNVTRKNASYEILSIHSYEFDGKDIMKETFTQYNGTSISWKEEWEYSDYDDGFNPEYLIEYPFPASLHNYNRLEITYTDYSSGSPVSEIFAFDYAVTLNESNAVETRKRVSNTGLTLIRNYSYENCE